MSMNDPLSDMLTRIRNGQQAGKPVIEAPFSRLQESVCAVLKDEGFIREYRAEERENNKKVLVIELKYAEGRGVIREIARVSKPGRRIYKAAHEVTRVRYGTGALLLSTPKGIKTDREARKEKIGGEALFQIW